MIDTSMAHLGFRCIVRENKPSRHKEKENSNGQKRSPSILVIWGDDIGISNLSCYSDGSMEDQTASIGL